MFGRERGSLEKSHSIGQTPCSYERYPVLNKTNTHRRRNATRQLTRVGVSGVYWALGGLCIKKLKKRSFR